MQLSKDRETGKMKRQTLLRQIALYSGFTGNDLRLILILCEKEMRSKEIAALMRWDKGNTSRALKKLVETGVVRKQESGAITYYKTNVGWTAPEVPGQITMDL